MKTKTYLKAGFREIRQSKGRFIAIILIVMLGTLLFVGVKTAGPVMQKTMSQYVEKADLSDLQIVSTAGLTQKDITQAEKIPGVQVETGKQLYYANPETTEIIHIFSYNKKNKQNQLFLVTGHLPKEENEIVLDEKAKKQGYKIGDTYRINTEDLHMKNYKVVGFVRSPLFINNLERGYTNLGNGRVDSFVYVPESQFKKDVQSVLYLDFTNVKGLDTYGQSYKNKMETNQEKTKIYFKDRPQERLDQLKQTAEEELISGKQELANAQMQVTTARKQLEEAKIQLARQEEFIEQLPEEQQTLLTQQKEELTQQDKILTEKEQDLVKFQSELQEMKGKLLL